MDIKLVLFLLNKKNNERDRKGNMCTFLQHVVGSDENKLILSPSAATASLLFVLNCFSVRQSLTLPVSVFLAWLSSLSRNNNIVSRPKTHQRTPTLILALLWGKYSPAQSPHFTVHNGVTKWEKTWMDEPRNMHLIEGSSCFFFIFFSLGRRTRVWWAR